MTSASIAPVRGAMIRVRALLPSGADYVGVRRGWLADLVSGVTVAVVALPLALAFGVASGVGATAGLVTAIVAGAVAAVFGGSHLQVSGPTGAMTIVLAPIVASHGVEAVPTIAVLAGLLVVIGGVLGLGRLVAFIPWPVVEGFTLGIALVIAAQQIPMALGLSKPPGNNAVLVAVGELARYAKHPAVPVVALLVLTTVLTAGLPRLHRALPAGLIAVGVATAVAEGLSLHVARIGSLPHGLPMPAVPPLHGAGALLMPAVVVAALASLESVLSARVADGMADLPRHDPNRELFGQGLANVAAGLFNGLPATGALARTAVNARAGARTRLAALVHAIVLAGVMALAAGLVSHIPLVALAGVLLVTAYRMVDRHTVNTVLRSTHTDALVFALTAAATVAFNLVIAVELGIGVAIVVALVKMSNTSKLVVDEDTVLEIAGEEEHALLRERVLVYRLDGPLFFAAASRFLDELTAIADVRVVVLRLRNLAMLDATGARAIEQVIGQLDARGIVVIVKVASGSHLRLLRAVGALDRLERRGHVHADLTTALQHAREHAMRDTPHTDPPHTISSTQAHVRRLRVPSPGRLIDDRRRLGQCRSERVEGVAAPVEDVGG